MDFIVFFGLSRFLSTLSLSYKYHPVLSTKSRTRLPQTLPLKPLRAPDFTATAITATSTVTVTATATATLCTSSLPRLLLLTQHIPLLVDLRPRLQLSVRDFVSATTLLVEDRICLQVLALGHRATKYNRALRLLCTVHRSFSLTTYLRVW